MTQNRSTYLVIVALLMASYLWLAWQYAGNARDVEHGVCLTKMVSGLPCPACGTSRSVLLLSDGQIGKAMMLNPLGLVALLALVGAPLWLAHDAVRRRPTLGTSFHWINKVLNRNKIIFWFLVLLLSANWVWNILKGL